MSANETNHVDVEPTDAERLQDDTIKKWPYWARPFLDHYRDSFNMSTSADAIGKSRSVVMRLQASNPAFAQAIQDCRDHQLDIMENVARARATSGQRIKRKVTKTRPDGKVEVHEFEDLHISDSLLMFTLKRWRPEFRENFRVEHTGADGAPIQVTFEEKVDEAAERFDATVVRLADARAARERAA